MLTRNGYCVPCAMLACALVTGCGEIDDDTRFITSTSIGVINQSDVALVEAYITAVDSPDYGPNLLEDGALLPDQDLIVAVQCDFYNARIVNDAGVACELLHFNTCERDATLVITNNACEAREEPADDDNTL